MSSVLSLSSMIAIAQTGGGANDNERIQNGVRLVWMACPTNCINDFTRDEYMSYGFVFENFEGNVCLPPGV